MFNKSFLVNKIVDSLLTKRFQVFLTRGCFDIAAKKDRLMLVKSLINVDGLSEEHALSLRAISYFVSAYPFVVSVKNNRGFLDDRMVYSRFGLPVVTPRMFNDILEGEAYQMQSAKGRHTVEIDVEAVRQKRKRLRLTLQQLADKAGISKKALYEIEKRRVNPNIETVKRLEIVLNMDLKNPFEPKQPQATYLKPKGSFQKKISVEFSRIGIENSAIHSAPFDLIGKESFSIITGLSTNTVKIKREATVVKNLSSIFSSEAFFVVKKSRQHSVEGVPVLLESELPEIDSAKELTKLIKEKQG